MTDPKIFVGTMWSGENDLPRCISKLLEQTGAAIDHHIITGMREREAHAALYGEWNARKATGGYDAFVQLDADTVLYRSHTLAEMFERLKAARVTGYTSIQSPLYDHLTDGPIMGLNMYTPDVIFNLPTDEVYCDRSTTNNRTLVETDTDPVGWHCLYASPIQSFHFGVHRGLKNKHGDKARIESALRDTQNLDAETNRAFALMGFEASEGFRSHKRTSYTDPEFQAAYVKACQERSSFMKRQR